MQAGFENFATVSKGQLLARDRFGPVTAPQSGIVLLPLYQQPGDDGFFVARAVRSFWLTLSAMLRRIGADRIVYRLPGVVRHPRESETVLVHSVIARWHTVEIFHLLGFRQRNSTSSGRLVFSRRLRGPI